MKKILVLGASLNIERYSNKLIHRLSKSDFEIIAVGRGSGEISGVSISSEWPKSKELDLISIYLAAQNQPFYYDFILNSNAKRIIFNPGAENTELHEMCVQKGLKVENACSLVQLSLDLL